MGNVDFACVADSPVDCGIVVTADGRFVRNIVTVTASLAPDPVAERLISGTTVASEDDEDNSVRFHPPDEDTESTDKVSAYVREVGVSADYEVTVSRSTGDTVNVGTYAGTLGNRPEEHDEITASNVNLKAEAAPAAASGWSMADLDGPRGVDTVSEFESSVLPEGKRRTQAWVVEDAGLPGGRGISLDLYTNAKPTGTTASAAEIFSGDAETDVTDALSDDGIRLVTDLRDDRTRTDHIIRRYAAQLEIQAESNERALGVAEADDNVDENKRIRLGNRTAVPGGSALGSVPQEDTYQPGALSRDRDTGTPAWFHGMPGQVVCGIPSGETEGDCGQDTYPVATSPDRVLVRSSGGPTFIADDGDHECRVPDADRVSIGVWSVRPASRATEGDVRMGAVHGSDPFTYSTATLDGEAEFDFDGRTVSGSITDFKLDGADDAENWAFTLTEGSIAALAENDGLDPSGPGDVMGIGGPTGVLGGVGSLMEGRPDMRLFLPQAENMAKPETVAGMFFAEQRRNRAIHDPSPIGASAAGPKPADE